MLSNWLKDNTQEAQQAATGWAAEPLPITKKTTTFYSLGT